MTGLAAAAPPPVIGIATGAGKLAGALYLTDCAVVAAAPDVAGSVGIACGAGGLAVAACGRVGCIVLCCGNAQRHSCLLQAQL